MQACAHTHTHSHTDTHTHYANPIDMQEAEPHQPTCQPPLDHLSRCRIQTRRRAGGWSRRFQNGSHLRLQPDLSTWKCTFHATMPVQDNSKSSLASLFVFCYFFLLLQGIKRHPIRNVLFRGDGDDALWVRSSFVTNIPHTGYKELEFPLMKKWQRAPDGF